MRQVTAPEFFAALGSQNVHPCIRRTPWPYISDWRLNAGHGPIVGRSEDHLRPGSALTETRYFLPLV